MQPFILNAFVTELLSRAKYICPDTELPHGANKAAFHTLSKAFLKSVKTWYRLG